MQTEGAKVKKMQEEYYALKKTGTPEEIKQKGKELGIAKHELTLKNKYYKEMVDETTTRLANVNEIAVAYVNGNMPNIYTINYNDAYKDLVKGIKGVSYNLVDEHTVMSLVGDGKLRLPKKSLNKAKDKRWNAKQLNSSILQGILQGEPIEDMANRILPIVNNNEKASVRTARTMTTQCENKGRMDRLDDFDEQGLEVEKEWIAIDDGRTRESHLEMAEIGFIPYDEPFPNELMYPADPDGDPEEVYNCRCSMGTRVLGWKKKR